MTRGPATALRTEEFVGVLALGLSTEEPTCGVRGDSLVAHQLSEVLPPGLQHGFVDVQSFAEFVLGLPRPGARAGASDRYAGPLRIDAMES